MYAVYINRGYAYFDEKTKTHLTRSNPKRVFTDEELKTLDMSGIERGIRLGTLRREEVKDPEEVQPDKEVVKETETEVEIKIEESSDKTSKTVEKESKEKPIEEEAENEGEQEVEKKEAEESATEEEGDFADLTKEGEPRCQAKKADGSQCTFAAKVPEDNPIYCGRHKDLLD